MGGSGISMNGFDRLCAATFAALIVLVLGPVAAASAQPTVTIAEPAAGAVEVRPTATIAGSTSDPFDPVAVSIYEGAGTLGTLVQERLVVLGGSEWSTQSSPLVDGTYTVVARQTEAGTLEAGASEEVTFTVAIDSIAPKVTLSSVPAAIDSSTPTFSGSASEEPGDGPVRVLVDGNLIGEAPVSSGSWQLTAPALADGEHSVSVEQRDEADNKDTDGPDGFRVDTKAPALTLAAVPTSTNDSTPTFSGSAGKDPGDGPVEVFVDGALAGQAQVTGGSWKYSSSALADGEHTVSVEQVDEVGNKSTEGPASFRVDTTLPILSFVQTPTPSKDRTPTISWVSGTAEGDLPLVSLKVINGKHETVREGASSNGAWAIPNAEALEDGTYTARIEQSDEAGNTANASNTPAATETFTVDNARPAVSISTPANGAHLKDAKPNFAGSAGTVGGGSKDSAEVTLNIYPGASATGAHETLPPITRNVTGAWSESNGPHLSDGTYTVQALQSDEAGNVGEDVHTFTIETNTPHVTLNSLPVYTNDATPSFAGSVDTTKGVVESVTVQVFRGNSVAGSAELAEPPIVVSGNGSTWSTGATGHLPDGTYTAQAKQENLAGTTGFSPSTTFTIDATAPTPTLSASEASNGLEVVSGVAGSAQGDHQQITAELFRGTTVEVGAAYETIIVKPSEQEHRWSATFAGLPEGQYTVIARQSDEAGNTGSSEPRRFTVTVPTLPPPTPAPSPSPPTASFTWVPAAPSVGQSISFVSKSTDPSSPLTAFAWDLAGSGAFAAGGPVATATFATAGAHIVRLRVSDANGLSSEVAETVNVGAQALRLMQPFPIVRIAGSETSFGAKVKLLTVQAPAAAKVTVSCKGRGCKTRSESRVATASSKTKGVAGAITLSFPRFERALQAGAVLQIRVSRSGEIGKFTSFTIRRRKLPLRVDACLRPPSTGPSSCPSQ